MNVEQKISRKRSRSNEACINENEYEVTGVAPFKVNIDIDENGKVVSVSTPQK